jgi:transcriptional regulator with XRE-family HTH domain
MPMQTLTRRRVNKRPERDWIEVGKRLREIREALGLTQAQFIEHMNDRIGYSVSLPEYSRWENGFKEVDRQWMPAIATLHPQHKAGFDAAWLAWGEQSVALRKQRKTEPDELSGKLEIVADPRKKKRSNRGA